MRNLVGLHRQFVGTITDPAYTSTLYALAVARHTKLEGSNDDGLAGGPVARVYTSQEAHSSVEKAVLTLGLGRSGVARIPTDDA